MSLYNTVNGINPAAFYVLPALGKHPEEYPRFRDCFYGKLSNSEEDKDFFGVPIKKLSKEKVISVYTRVGGNNRGSFISQIEEMRKMPNYLEDYDDNFDNTFATFVFSVPEEWKEDIEKIMEGKAADISNKYVEQLKKVYPKLAHQFDTLFSKS